MYRGVRDILVSHLCSVSADTKPYINTNATREVFDLYPHSCKMKRRMKRLFGGDDSLAAIVHSMMDCVRLPILRTHPGIHVLPRNNKTRQDMVKTKPCHRVQYAGSAQQARCYIDANTRTMPWITEQSSTIKTRFGIG